MTDRVKLIAELATRLYAAALIQKAGYRPQEGKTVGECVATARDIVMETEGQEFAAGEAVAR